MAKKSSTQAPAHPGSTSTVAPAGSSPAGEPASALVKAMLSEHLPAQSAAIERRSAAALPRPGSAAPGELTTADRPLLSPDFYPEHDRGVDSPQYAQVHKRLCITMDLPCLVCGVRNSTLANPAENRYGARQLETHHHVIEWALADAVDVARFNKTIRPHLQARQKDQPIYQRDMSAQEVHDWVDHAEDNLWVLCDIHHRHQALGIHKIAYPVWCPQDLLRPDFAEYVRQQSAPPVAAAIAPAMAGKAAATAKPAAAGKPAKRRKSK